MPAVTWRGRLVCASVISLFAGCDSREAAPPSAQPEPPAAKHATPAPAEAVRAPLREERSVISSESGIATWYDVRPGSLPERRAPGELTAAHDRLALGSYARVTNKLNQRSVVVRITDRGVGKKRGIDLCKDAAEQIGLVGKGEAKVMIEAFEHHRPGINQ